MRLAHRLLDFSRIRVQNELRAHREAQVGPAALENVGHRQERHHAVFLRHGHALAVGRHRGVILAVGQNDALRVARGAARVDDVADVVHRGLAPELLHLRLSRQVLAQRNEVLEIERVMVVRGDAHAVVEHDDSLQRGAERKDAVRLVVLLLLAHEEEAHASVLHHVLNLLLARRGVNRNRHHAHAVGSEVGIKILDTVLGEHGDSLLRLQAEVQKRVRHLFHTDGKLVPRHRLPLLLAEHLEGEHGLCAVSFRLLVNERRIVAIVLHFCLVFTIFCKDSAKNGENQIILQFFSAKSLSNKKMVQRQWISTFAPKEFYFNPPPNT